MTRDLRIWSRRVPLAVLSLGVAVPLAALVAIEIVASAAPCTAADRCREPLRSASYWAAAPTVALTLTMAIAAFVVPRLAVWGVVAVGSCNVAFGSVATSAPAAWLVSTLAWTLLGAAEVLRRRRQAELVRSWALPLYRPEVPDTALHWTHDTRKVAALAAAALVVVAVALSIWHERELRSVERFEAAAIEVTGTVVGRDENDNLVVDIDGRRYTIPWVVDSYEPDVSVPVLIDPAGTRTALTSEPMDPSWLVGLAAIVIFAAIAVFVQGFSRGSRRVALLRNGGPQLELWLESDEHNLLAPSPRAAPCAMLPGDLLSTSFAVKDGQPTNTDLDEPRSDDDEELDLPPPSKMSDDDVRAWLGWVQDEGEDVPPRAQGLVRVIGPLVDGFPVMVLTGNEVLLSERGLRDPWSLGRLWSGLFRRAAPRRAEAPENLSVRVRRWHPTPGVSILMLAAAYVLAVAASTVLGWVIDDPDVPLSWGDLPLVLLVGAVAAGLNALARIGRPQLARHRSGLRVFGWLLTSIIPVRRVVGVTVVDQSLVLRLREPEELIPVEADRVAGTEGSSSNQTAASVRGWLESADGRSAPNRRLSASAGPPLLFLGLVVFQVIRLVSSLV